MTGEDSARNPAIYAWMEVEPDGKEGVIAAGGIIAGSLALLQSRRREIADQFRPIAEAHGKAMGRTVRLVEFTRARTLVEIPK